MKRKCPRCGKTMVYQHKRTMLVAVRKKSLCRACTYKCRNQRTPEIYRGVAVGWVMKKKVNARMRKIAWKVTPQYVIDQYIEQGRRCKLTGVRLRAPSTTDFSNVTVSIDRIDSSKGYIEGNIQIIDKRVNMMKYTFSQQEFVRWCKRVARHADRRKK